MRAMPTLAFTCLLSLVTVIPAVGKVGVEPNPAGAEPYRRCAAACDACGRDCDAAARRLVASPIADRYGECREACAKAARLVAGRNPASRAACIECIRTGLACAAACEQAGDDAQVRQCAQSCRECAAACQAHVEFLDWCNAG